MRAALACLLLVSACAAPPPGQVATVPDQDWIGMIYCDTIPDLTRISLHQPFHVVVRGGIARYERNVRRPDSSLESGFKESGEGAVAPDGRVELNGTGSSQRSTYIARYTGVLAGSHTRLDGVQHWTFEHHAPYDRTCHIDLTHQL